MVLRKYTYLACYKGAQIYGLQVYSFFYEILPRLSSLKRANRAAERKKIPKVGQALGFVQVADESVIKTGSTKQPYLVKHEGPSTEDNNQGLNSFYTIGKLGELIPGTPCRLTVVHDSDVNSSGTNRSHLPQEASQNQHCLPRKSNLASLPRHYLTDIHHTSHDWVRVSVRYDATRFSYDLGSWRGMLIEKPGRLQCLRKSPNQVPRLNCRWFHNYLDGFMVTWMFICGVVSLANMLFRRSLRDV